MSSIPKISLMPEIVTKIGSFELSNAVVSAFIVTLIILVISFYLKKQIKLVPGRLQVIAEEILDFFYDRLMQVYNDSSIAKKQISIILSLFLFVFIANQFSLIPLVQSIVVNHEEPLFRVPTTHLSLTIALAIVVVFLSHVLGFMTSPLNHIGNFFRVKSLIKSRSLADVLNAMLDIFIGLLEIVGEFAKVVSLSCRLFGNIFAGEVVVAVISGLSAYTAYLIPVPFYFLTIFDGMIQAGVFAILALSYITTSVSHAKAHH